MVVVNPRCLALIALVAVVGGCDRPPDVVHEFALFGDNPYSIDGVTRVRAVIADVNEQPNIDWVIHVGDIKGGSQPCTDELLRNRFDLFQEFSSPFVFTPGDNDWFDCISEAAGAFDDHERLAFLRSLFFPNPDRTTGGTSMAVRTQSAEGAYPEFVENVLWVRGGVVYATVHLIAMTRDASDPATATRRTDAAISWLQTTFDVANELEADAVFIATQADLWPGASTEPRSGLEEMYPVLVNLATQFQRPVVMAVGDTHIFRVDKPLYRPDGRLVENFTRVETFGNPYVHWVRVVVDTDTRDVFAFHQELVPANFAQQ